MGVCCIMPGNFRTELSFLSFRSGWLCDKIDDDDDDDEDEQEEEPKPARRRATTQAAGQEVYMSHKPRKDEWDDEYWPKPSATRHIRTGMHGT